MSFKSWLHDIGDKIKSAYNKLKPAEKQAIDIGVVITDKIKKTFDSGYVDIATSLIPGTLDNEIAALVKAALPKIVTELQLASKCMNETDPDKILACAIETLKGLTGSTVQYDFLDSLATQISVVAADGKLTWDDVKSTVKWYNDHVKEKLPVPAAGGN